MATQQGKTGKRHHQRIPALDQKRAIYNALGNEKGIANSPGFLRLEALLGATSVISFDLLVNQGKPTKTENRLQITDTFIVTDLGFFVFKVAAGATTTLGKLRTFANPTIFSAAGEADRINAIWESGKFQMTKNGVQSIPALDMERFRSVGIAQEGLQVGAANSYFADERRDARVGFIETFTPVITFQGNDNVTLNVNLPESVNLAGTDSDNYAVLYFRGFLRQNASFVGRKNNIKSGKVRVRR